MKKRTIKTRIIATVLSVITLFSLFSACATTSASALEIDYKRIIKEAASNGAEKAIDAVTEEGIVNTVLKKGVNFLLGLLFDEDDNSPTIQDVLDKLDNLSSKLESYHDEEMKNLRLINSNIDSKDFRLEADSISDDCQAAVRKIRQFDANITTPGEGVIDNTTYKTYNKILSQSSCDLSALEKNFNRMVEYIKGVRSSTDYRSGYRVTSEYLMNKILANYKETAHDWATSPDFLEYLNNINEEIELMEANVTLDYFTILTLNNMAYKVREYEIKNGIYEANDNEQPYAYFESFAKDLTDSLSSVNDIYKSVIEENNNNGDFMQATAEILTPVGGKCVKGFHTLAEAWAQSFKASTRYVITLNGDVKADANKGFNIDNLSDTNYGFCNYGGFHVDLGRTVRFDLNGHTLDCSANKNTIIFAMNDRANIIVTNGTIIGGSVAFDEINRDLNSVTLRSVTIRNTANAAINLNTGSTKSQWLVMDKCKVENCGRIQVFSVTANIKVTNSEFNNLKSDVSGGAFYLPSINYPTFENCTFKGNKAMQGCGGAIDAKSVICKNCTFENNTSENSNQYGPKGAGGAIAANALKLYDCTFTGNMTNDQAGAVWCCGQNYTQIIERCTFDNNSSKNVGGAVRIDLIDGNAHSIKNCTFTNNTSGRGAAVLVENFCGHCDDIAYHWGNSGSNNRCTTGYDARKVVAEFAWGLSGARR
ncbi:MAG TPA: hypothetical protein DCY72_04975 [Ruminococcaceae bacterium]|nr:hypothetical protein [Oscillospiraceae bacterium]